MYILYKYYVQFVSIFPKLILPHTCFMDVGLLKVCLTSKDQGKERIEDLVLFLSCVMKFPFSTRLIHSLIFPLLLMYLMHFRSLAVFKFSWVLASLPCPCIFGQCLDIHPSLCVPASISCMLCFCVWVLPAAACSAVQVFYHVCSFSWCLACTVLKVEGGHPWQLSFPGPFSLQPSAMWFFQANPWRGLLYWSLGLWSHFLLFYVLSGYRIPPSLVTAAKVVSSFYIPDLFFLVSKYGIQ